MAYLSTLSQYLISITVVGVELQASAKEAQNLA